MTSKLYIVGLGPGDSAHLTPAARAAIERADVVTGYKTYLELIPELVAGKQTFSTGMRQETERCREALHRAAAGATVALVCSGDAGIYGMAGLVLELQQAEGPKEVEVEVVPGVSAVQGAAARLGAPLMHDFAVISLSDLLTDWQLIRRRLEAAAQADFVIALYNPKSKGRVTQIEEAREILLAYRDPATPVGIVRNACREGETVTVSDLASFTSETIDMFSLVIIGNSTTFVDDAGRMVTPRGYELRRQEAGDRRQEANQTRQSDKERLTPALFVGGTGSDVGKSVLVAGLGRLLARKGVRVLPFKAQNMANNAAVCADGSEIGRAQALQALACGFEPVAQMNPILLKPNSETGSQVVALGRPVGNMDVRTYHAWRDTGWAIVEKAYRQLAEKAEVMLIEGAGSIAEINLRDKDITNLAVARMADAGVLLVADIERGGVFASILGTLQLLDPSDRARVVGVVINRFRGDATLLEPGIRELETRTGVPVLGVVPWLDLHLPAEDSLALDNRVRSSEGVVRIGVVRLPRIANSTDFEPFEQEPGVVVQYLTRPEELTGIDLLILPGTKSTLADLDWLRRSGLAEAIRAWHAAGGRIIGICGGFQMLGRRVTDPDGVEGEPRETEGLGLLDIETVMRPVKQTHQVEATFLTAAAAAGFAGFEKIQGYEIHAGETSYGILARPLLRLTRRSGEDVAVEDGAVSSDGRVWGSYLHGLFDDERLRHALLLPLFLARGIDPGSGGAVRDLDGELDRLARHLEEHLDLGPVWRHLGLEDVSP